MQSIQVVCGLFYSSGSFAKAKREFRWSIRQNKAFWKEAVLYLDPESAVRLSDFQGAFREVVVDEEIPALVRSKMKWNCKGWWAKKAVERFGRILFCDFDIYVRKAPDGFLNDRLGSGPRFLDIPVYQSPTKAVGCGCVLYDTNCDWDRFLPLLYDKWHCDERAWTEALSLSREALLARSLHMNPYIVDQAWLLRNSEMRNEAYIIHGISSWDDGQQRLRDIGYAADERHLLRSFPVRLRDGVRAFAKGVRAMQRRLTVGRGH